MLSGDEEGISSRVRVTTGVLRGPSPASEEARTAMV
jgi:hypothetical protein